MILALLFLLEVELLDSRLSAIDLKVPQVRNNNIPFYPNALERGQRSEKALTISVAEMYLQCVSTRRVTHILKAPCGLEVTSIQVSRAMAEIDPMLEAWPSRPIPPIAHLILDARYEKIRVAGIVRSCAVFTAIGIRSHDEKRTILGTSISLFEAEIHWRDFLSNLKSRGLFPTGSITSDAHEGLKAALASVFPGMPWNRCQFHPQQNAQSYVPKQEMKSSVTADIYSIFNSESLAVATQKLAAAVEKYSAIAPKLEASIFPNEASCLRLVSAVLMELSDDWESSNAYLNPQFLR